MVFRSHIQLYSIKWKPPSENTIDFKLRLHFPPDLAKDPRGMLPDLTAKPFFALDEYMGRERGGNADGYRYFDWLYVEDEEWEDMKKDGEQFDDRIVECYWDLHGGPIDPRYAGNGIAHESRPPAWRLHRIRDDKTDGNHTSIVQKIIRSIEDGVEKDQLLAQETAIRAAWKSEERSAFRRAQTTPQVVKMGPSPPMRGSPPEDLIRR
jgi:mRNA guanylyltransferase